MLDALRKGAGTWIAKLFIALLIFSFAIWGVTDFLQGFGQNTAAKVGNAEVSLLDFDREYRQDLNRLGQQLGRPLTPAEGAQLGIPQQTLGKLVAEAAMDNTTQELKLGISDERLAGMIQSDPAFQGPSGRYDRTRLQQLLSANGYREDEYVINRRRIAERSQLAEGIAGGMKAPVSYVELLDTYQNEKRSADFIRISAEQIGEIEDPSEDVLTAYYDVEKAQFRAPEYREIKYVSLTPTTLARPGDITDEDALAEYDRRKVDFFEPERRKVRQLSFPSAEAAQEAAEEISAGKTFDDIMADRNLTSNDVALGIMARTDFLDTALGDAAFALGAGETSGAVDGRFSTVILNVEEVLPQSTTPFEEVKSSIVDELAREQAEREILDLLDEVEDARAGGALLDEVGERFSLTVEAPEAFDSAGKAMSGADAVLPQAEGLIAGAFDSDVGIENDVLQIDDRGFLWYDVTKVIPARDRDLAEVRDDVVAAWKADELAKRLSEKAADILAKAEGGTSLTDLATEESIEVQTVENVSRGQPASDLGREATAALFDGPVGTVSAAATDDGTARLILKVTASERPAFDASAQQSAALGSQVSQQLQDVLLGQFINRQEEKSGVEVNNAGIAQVIGLNQENRAY